MNCLRLTSEEIEKLYDFCYEHDVDEFEIQSELVDHLASDIEHQWLNEPDRSFDKSLQKAFASFGEKGFSEVVKKRKQAFRRQYQRLFAAFFLSFFKLPRIIASCSLLFVVYFALRITGNREVVLYTIESIFLACFFGYIFFYYPKRMKLDVVGDKQFLLLEYYSIVRSLSLLIYVLFQTSVNALLKHFTLSGAVWMDAILAATTVLVTITMIVLMFFLPGQIKNHFLKNYKQFVKV